MDHVPEPDELEQREPAGNEGTEVLEAPPDLSGRPEADVVEQAQLVEEDQYLLRTKHRDDVSEADWLEQSIGEPAEEERR